MTPSKRAKRPRDLDREIEVLKTELAKERQGHQQTRAAYETAFARKNELLRERDEAKVRATEAEKSFVAERELRATAEIRASRAEGYADALLARAYPAAPTAPWRETKVDQWGNPIFVR